MCVSVWSILTLSPKSATLAVTPLPSPLLLSMTLRALRSECSTFIACRWHMAFAMSSAVSRMAQ